MNILEGYPRLRSWFYWGNTIAIAAIVIVTAWYESTVGWVPDQIEIVGKFLLALGSFTNITAATNINGDAIDPTALPPSLRKALNLVFGIAQAALLLLAIIFSQTDGPEPFWVLGLNAVLLAISGMLSLTAASHVVPNPPPSDESQPERIVGGSTV